VANALREQGFAAVSYYRRSQRLPYRVARLIPGLLERLGDDDRFGWRGSRNTIPARIPVTRAVAWLLGLYVAEGYRRPHQVTISNTDQSILDRATAVISELGLDVYRGRDAITAGSSAFSSLLDWLGAGGTAPTKRVPPVVFAWRVDLVAAFLEGVVDGDGSVKGGRTSVWTTSAGLRDDLLLVFARLGRRAASCRRPRRGNAREIWQVSAPNGEHKLLTSVPLPDRLLVDLRSEAGLSQAELASLAGFSNPNDLCNIENRTGQTAVRRRTLGRVRDALRSSAVPLPDLRSLDRLVDGHVAWDEVLSVRDTGVCEPIFDLEVRPSGRKIENFLTGGGVFVSNTAGFIDPGFDGHITLELANVATLPITLYPGMKIGQISFVRMTTPADVPYGSGKLGSKYQGQRGPTPSRYFENFRDD
jgi:dCTP deaminase